ncbi:palmitoyl-monogalactosyldiacylglycerol delta-7 desaturase, chloroplastic-like [Cucumis melo]|uniref:Palmitoyl-monogalactosyldiacylglycerol delta-7 desaturase, chloroplastic-like n=1 Tax=Cucumis melo TaxID=3656 RepID=A0A1S3BMC9_CUCME|nr:palmitoyl-monogalactosyldiacylglycerol delta-7 desaturase, chloroplastic-like [Cucumis melo]
MEATMKDREKPHRAFWRRKWTFSDIRTAIYILMTHSLCIFAPFHFNWKAFWVAFTLYVLVAIFGITLSYHRNLTHKSFKLPKWLEYSFAYMGVMALQGDPIDWVSTHRHHHQFVETERDPHSPIHGLWYSHMGWTMNSRALTKRHGRPNNVSDLEDQIFYRIIQKTYLLHPLALGIVLFLIGGFPFLVWSGGVAVTWGYHVTSMVNSICHSWGSQPWKTRDSSKNNWLVSLVTFGEGWHNNHHAFEYSARHGLEWWQLDIPWYIILCLQALGLATNVKFPTEKQKLDKAFSTSKNTT